MNSLGTVAFAAHVNILEGKENVQQVENDKCERDIDELEDVSKVSHPSPKAKIHGYSLVGAYVLLVCLPNA